MTPLDTFLPAIVNENNPPIFPFFRTDPSADCFMGTGDLGVAGKGENMATWRTDRFKAWAARLATFHVACRVPQGTGYRGPRPPFSLSYSAGVEPTWTLVFARPPAPDWS